MSLFKRIGRTVLQGHGPLAKDPQPRVHGADHARPAERCTSRWEGDEPLKTIRLADVLRVEEVADAEFYIGELFRRRFRAPPPDWPRHFVAFYRESVSRYVPLGYVHYSHFEDSYLCGGLVIDERQYRRIPPAHRDLIRRGGGVAEQMLRDSFAALAEAPAIWGYVGDRQSEKVTTRVGFRRTRHPYVMVVWNKHLEDTDKAERLDRVIGIGPF
jgi:hypothetical protein